MMAVLSFQHCNDRLTCRFSSTPNAVRAALYLIRENLGWPDKITVCGHTVWEQSGPETTEPSLTAMIRTRPAKRRR